MNVFPKILLTLCLTALPLAGVAKDKSKQEIATNKQERILIRKGNKLFNQKRYAEAEVQYRKATQANPASPIAAFNLATALLKQDNGAQKSQDKNTPASQARTQLENIIKTCPDKELTSQAFYDLGNMEFNAEKWDKAIACYKDALRRNPADNQARENLRLAQLKKKESEQNQQNQQNNQDKDNKQDKQDKQNDKNEKDKQNQDNKQDQNKDQQNQQQQQQQQQGMSQQNVEQVLKTMQDKEQETQRKVNASQAEKKKAERRRTQNQW